jgi:hypothetical protein
MPLGFLMLDHFVDSIATLELNCAACGGRIALRPDELAIGYGRFVSVPELKRIGMTSCLRSDADCMARFPQLEQMFSSHGSL